jgi:hypothetical protein
LLGDLSSYLAPKVFKNDLSFKYRRCEVKNRNRGTRHHIWPLSRGGTDKPQNIIVVSTVKHRAYHILFSNKLPTEILQELRAIYDRTSCDSSLKDCWRIVFGDIGPTRATEALFEKWGFGKYFYQKVNGWKSSS